jgi:excisionase family DNA binding protein
MDNTLDTIGTNTHTDVGQNNRRFMNVNELAALLGVSRWTIFRLCKDRGIPFITLGRRTKRFDRAEIEAAILKRTIKAKI